MTIGYEAKRIFHNASGLGNYGRNLLRALSTYYPDDSYILYNPSPATIPFGDYMPSLKEENPLIKNKLYANLWRQRLVADRAKNQKVEIFHGLSQELPLGLSRKGIKSVVSVHDAIFIRYPHLYKYIDRKIYSRKLKSACKRADRIVAISEQTKRDLIEFFKIPQERIQVIYQGVNPIYWETFEDETPEDVLQRFELPEEFALFVGTLEERKGVEKLLEAQRKTGIPIVYIGRKTPFWNNLLKQDKYKSLNSIIFTPEVRLDEDLAKIYRLAKVFIYPSIFEGFGIPVLEALISKTPVITSNVSSLPEVAGPSSILVNPLDQGDINQALERVWQNPELREEMVTAGYTFAENFKDEQIAGQWHRLYKNLIS